MAQGNDEGNAFTFDDDEDMDFLLEQAANAGSAAVDEQHDGSDFASDLFGNISDTPQTAPVAVAQPEPQPEPEPAIEVEEPFNFDEFDLDQEAQQPAAVQESPAVSDVERDLAALRAETEAALREPIEVPVAKPEAKPEPARGREPVRSPAVEELLRTPTPSPTRDRVPPSQQVEAPPVAPAPASNAPRIVRQTEAEQIAHAKAILDAADEYRKLNSEERGVVAQLITQDAEFADDAASVAIRAINADELTFETMAALKTAKSHEPVDRAFYILGLPDDVRTSLGQLCAAFSGTEFKGGDTLAFSRELVKEIEALDSGAIGFVSSTEAVLRAAKQR